MKPSDPNPYQAPLDVQSRVASPTVAAVGKRRLKEETNLKQMTIALIVIFALFGGILLSVDSSRVSQLQAWEYHAMGGLLTLAAIVGLVVNWGVRSYASWAKIPLTILCVLGLPFLPLGTAFGATILRIVYSRRRPKILSAEYQALVKAYPQKSDRLSIMAWIAIVLLAILVISWISIRILVPRPAHP